MDKRDNFKHYRITYPNGEVSAFSHQKVEGLAFSEETIKNMMKMKDPKTGNIIRPVKVKRTK